MLWVSSFHEHYCWDETIAKVASRCHCGERRPIVLETRCNSSTTASNVSVFHKTLLCPSLGNIQGHVSRHADRETTTIYKHKYALWGQSREQTIRGLWICVIWAFSHFSVPGAVCLFFFVWYPFIMFSPIFSPLPFSACQLSHCHTTHIL